MKRYILNVETRDPEIEYGLFPYMNATKIESQEVLDRSKSFFSYFLSENISFKGMYLDYGKEIGIPKIPHKLCDMHAWVGSQPKALTYPVSINFCDLLLNFNITQVHFYKGSVLWRGIEQQYYVMQILTNQFQYIDFNKSTFVKCNFRGLRKSEEEKTGLSMDELNTIYGDDSFTFARAVMKPEFRELDVYYLDIWGTLITERLKNAIEAASLSGLKITECPLKFEFSDEV